MERLRYLAYDERGRRVASTVTGASVEQVKAMLWSEGLFPVRIGPPPLGLTGIRQGLPGMGGVSRADLILFSRQLAAFVRVGIPLLEALAVLRDQAAAAPLRKALGQVLEDLGRGASLSAALSRHPRIFSGVYVDMIRSAEASGRLDDVLRQLVVYQSRDESALRKVRNAMIYPAIVVGLAFAVVAMLVGFVLPAFARLFEDFGTQMPLPTRVLLATGLFCRDHAAAIFTVAAVLVLGAAAFFQTQRGRDVADALSLRVPVVGGLLRYAVIERYLRTLAALARAGVPITQMLETANRALGNAVFRRGLAEVKDQMLSGEGFAVPMERTGLFPRLVIQMVKVGEETGSLDVNLEEAADHFAEEVDYRLKQLMALMEPALVIAVGAMVGFIAIAVIAPMYGLASALH